MEPETASLRLRYRRTRSITSLFGIQAGMLKVRWDLLRAQRKMKSQEQNVTSERNWEEAGTNLTRVDSLLFTLHS